MKELSGRVALVTGGVRGIGWACAQRLASAGAAVAMTWRSDRASALEAVRGIRELGGPAEAVRLDLESGEGVAGAVDFVVERLGRLDICVNSAGIWNVESSVLPAVADDDLSRMLKVNLEGAIKVTRAVIPVMVGQGHGRIIHIGSTAGIRGEAGHSIYAASKGALLAFARSLVGELAGKGVTVNVVAPGWVFTDMTREVLTPDAVERIEASIPTGRISRPDDIAHAVHFLAGPGAAQVNGISLDVNGGAVFS